MKLEIEDRCLGPFLATLGLGVLYAIQAGDLGPDAGVGTLGPPRVWEPLVGSPAVPEAVVRVFATADELEAINLLLPDRFGEKLQGLIGELVAALHASGEASWGTAITWSDAEEQG